MPSSQRFEGGNFGESVRSAAPVAGAQRVGPLAVIPGLLRELGADPDQGLASVGLDAAALNDVENWIPYVAMGRLLRVIAGPASALGGQRAPQAAQMCTRGPCSSDAVGRHGERRSRPLSSANRRAVLDYRLCNTNVFEELSELIERQRPIAGIAQNYTALLGAYLCAGCQRYDSRFLGIYLRSACYRPASWSKPGTGTGLHPPRTLCQPTERGRHSRLLFFPMMAQGGFVKRVPRLPFSEQTEKPGNHRFKRCAAANFFATESRSHVPPVTPSVPRRANFPAVSNFPPRTQIRLPQMGPMGFYSAAEVDTGENTQL